DAPHGDVSVAWPLIRGQQACQFAGLVQPDQVVSAADVSLADHDLRERPGADAVAEPGTHAVDVPSGLDLVDRGAMMAQAPPGAKAVTAQRNRVEGDLGQPSGR